MAWVKCTGAPRTFYDRTVMGDAKPLVFSKGKAETTAEIAQALAEKYEAFSVLAPKRRKKAEDKGGEDGDK